jgi:arylsulfatase A-like enzyme
VLLVTVDTLRLDRLSGYGYERPTSPHIDRLMAAGTRFRQARCVEPLTSPSLASMLTSLYPHEHGASRNGLAMRPDLPSLPKILHRRGYRTAAMVGSWTLRDDLSGLAEHFESYQEILTRRRWLGLIRGEATAEDVTAAAVSFVEEHRAAEPLRPFLLWVHYVEPHAPYRFHQEFARRLGLEDSQAPSKSDRYDTEIAFVDEAVADLLRQLERLDPGRPTAIVFAADHGENLGEHDYWGHGRFLWEESLRIPLSITWQGRIPARQALDFPVSNLDVAPTLLGLLGLPVPEAFQGRNWAPVLLREEAPPSHSTTFHQAHKGAVSPNKDREQVRRKGLLEVSLVRDSHKETLRLKGGPEVQAFDLARDPGENKSLISGAPATASAGLEAWLQEVEAGLRSADDLPPPALDAESVEKLRSLGYLD